MKKSSPCRHGRVGESYCINTPGCQTVKFLWTLRAKCQLKTNWEKPLTIWKLGQQLKTNQSTTLRWKTGLHLRRGLDRTAWKSEITQGNKTETQEYKTSSGISNNRWVMSWLNTRNQFRYHSRRVRCPTACCCVCLSFQKLCLSIRMRWL